MISQVVLTAMMGLSADAASGSQAITIDSVLLSAVDESIVAAMESGAIRDVAVRRGQSVTQGETLAQIDDAVPRLAQDRAAIELEIATQKAGNDISTRHARKALEVATAELRRAEQAIKKYPESVPDNEMDRLQLTVDRDALAVEQSEHDRRIAAADVRLKTNELNLAQLRVARCRVVAPFTGIVAEVSRSPGEWVEPGGAIVRLLRTDRLRAEGFVAARYAHVDLCGRTVRLLVGNAEGSRVELEGEIVFVGPKIDPVNAQVLVGAEFDNRRLQLRPGVEATMKIELPPRPLRDK